MTYKLLLLYTISSLYILNAQIPPSSNGDTTLTSIEILPINQASSANTPSSIESMTFHIKPNTYNSLILAPGLFTLNSNQVFPLIGFTPSYNIQKLPSWGNFNSENRTVSFNAPETFNESTRVNVSFSDPRGNSGSLEIILTPDFNVMTNQNFAFVATNQSFKKPNTCTMAYPIYSNPSLQNLGNIKFSPSNIFLINQNTHPWTTIVKLKTPKQLAQEVILNNLPIISNISSQNQNINTDINSNAPIQNTESNSNFNNQVITNQLPPIQIPSNIVLFPNNQPSLIPTTDPFVSSISPQPIPTTINNSSFVPFNPIDPLAPPNNPSTPPVDLITPQNQNNNPISFPSQISNLPNLNNNNISFVNTNNIDTNNQTIQSPSLPQSNQIVQPDTSFNNEIPHNNGFPQNTFIFSQSDNNNNLNLSPNHQQTQPIKTIETNTNSNVLQSNDTPQVLTFVNPISTISNEQFSQPHVVPELPSTNLNTNNQIILNTNSNSTSNSILNTNQLPSQAIVQSNNLSHLADINKSESSQNSQLLSMNQPPIIDLNLVNTNSNVSKQIPKPQNTIQNSSNQIISPQTTLQNPVISNNSSETVKPIQIIQPNITPIVLSNPITTPTAIQQNPTISQSSHSNQTYANIPSSTSNQNKSNQIIVTTREEIISQNSQPIPLSSLNTAVDSIPKINSLNSTNSSISKPFQNISSSQIMNQIKPIQNQPFPDLTSLSFFSAPFVNTSTVAPVPLKLPENQPITQLGLDIPLNMASPIVVTPPPASYVDHPPVSFIDIPNITNSSKVLSIPNNQKVASSLPQKTTQLQIKPQNTANSTTVPNPSPTTAQKAQNQKAF